MKMTLWGLVQLLTASTRAPLRADMATLEFVALVLDDTDKTVLVPPQGPKKAGPLDSPA